MTAQSSAFHGALRLLREPVPEEKKRLMRERWESLDPRWRFPAQGLGQKATGCGATIGLHPRCDFDCTGCYLGSEANQIKPVGRDDAFKQLDALRAWLGPKGNVQITDGEVTLLPVDDLIAILLHARAIGLIPMVMSHGDSFRRRPDLLPRLVLDGSLTEVSIHVDTTQRGRLGYKNVGDDERALTPLREEFAEMIRTVRRTTGVNLRAAMTLTITRDNLEGVAPVVEWCFKNRDVFGMLSFQPMAHVGRTEEHLQGVRVDELWERIEAVLVRYGFEGRGPLRFGHPDCSRVEALGVYERKGALPRVFPIVREGNAADHEIMTGFLDRGLGGVSFRDDTLPERLCRMLGVFLADPSWFLGPVRGWLSNRVRELGASYSGLTLGAIRKQIRIDGFSVVSHHFMSPAELETDLGKERLAACLFRLPINGEMVSMCRVNASGAREGFYGEISARRAAQTSEQTVTQSLPRTSTHHKGRSESPSPVQLPKQAPVRTDSYLSGPGSAREHPQEAVQPPSHQAAPRTSEGARR